MSATLPVPGSRAPSARWAGPLLALLALVACLALLYRDTLVAMVGIWYRSDTFAHAFLVLPISLWLAWRLRHRLDEAPVRPAPWALVPMALAGLAWLVGELAGVNALTQFAFTALLVLAVVAVLGLRVSRILAFPLAFLFFMVPFGEFLLPWLMDWTADFTVEALRLSGIPVYREGLQFVIPTGSWSVVEACSGVRYLIASFMVGSLFAYLNYESLGRRLVFCAVSLAVPLVANWLRAYMIVMLGHLSGNRIAVGVDHLIYGWVFFGIVVAVMFMIGARWAEPAPDLGPRGAASAATSGSAGFWAVAAAAALILLLPQAMNWRAAAQPAPAGRPAMALPELAGAPRLPAEAPPLEPEFLKPSFMVTGAYGVRDRAVWVHVAYYRQQRFGSKLVSSQNVLVHSLSEKWQPAGRGVAITQHRGSALPWRSTELLGGHVAASSTQRTRAEVRQLYWVNGRFTSSDMQASLLGLWGKLRGDGDEGAMVTIYAVGDAAATGPLLDGFAQQHLGALEKALADHRAGP